MTTQELVERLEKIAIKRDLTASVHSNPDLRDKEREAAKTLRTAASRIEEMDAEIKRLREACLQAALTFRFYEQSHLAKKTQDGDEKAYRNHEMAAMCEAALEQQQKGEGL